MAIELLFNHHEFEKVVRDKISVYDRAVTDEDVLSIYELDLSNFSFYCEDYDTISYFKNLRLLNIETCIDILDFLDCSETLNELYITCYGVNGVVDLNKFSRYKNLSVIFISGGDYSNMNLINLNGLFHCNNLVDLSFHEFGYIDLFDLKNMKQIRKFFCAYANKIDNIDSIGHLENLEELTICDIEIKNIDFLDNISDTVSIDFSSLRINTEIDMNKFNRFKNAEINDILN